MATTPTMIRIEDDLKAAATKRAAEQNRSLANYISWLIMVDMKKPASEGNNAA